MVKQHRISRLTMGDVARPTAVRSEAVELKQERLRSAGLQSDDRFTWYCLAAFIVQREPLAARKLSLLRYVFTECSLVVESAILLYCRGAFVRIRVTIRSIVYGIHTLLPGTERTVYTSNALVVPDHPFASQCTIPICAYVIVLQSIVHST